MKGASISDTNTTKRKKVMFRKATIKKESPETKKLMLIANELEKNLKDLKKIIVKAQTDTQNLADYKNWCLYGEGVPTENNPYFNETDFAQHELNLEGAKERRAIARARHQNNIDADRKINQSGKKSGDWNHIQTLKQTTDLKIS